MLTIGRVWRHSPAGPGQGGRGYGCLRSSRVAGEGHRNLGPSIQFLILNGKINKMWLYGVQKRSQERENGRRRIDPGGGRRAAAIALPRPPSASPLTPPNTLKLLVHTHYTPRKLYTLHLYDPPGRRSGVSSFPLTCVTIAHTSLSNRPVTAKHPPTTAHTCTKKCGKDRLFSDTRTAIGKKSYTMYTPGGGRGGREEEERKREGRVREDSEGFFLQLTHRYERKMSYRTTNYALVSLIV
jgi:hypothetical protein